ncbi:uncharacterized protein [Watersipora subatra]|uniref:uncharacterized protein isoform X2 n=1 Tax=Watersipora subatra TaxID=2589382 RepID=UPI00355C8E82
MYNNWYSQPSTSNSANSSSWVQEAGYQTDRTGFGFKQQSGAAMLASLDDKVADADSKLRDFMAEIESLDTGDAAASETPSDATRSSMPGFVSGGHVLPATSSAESERAAEESAAAEEPVVEPTTSWQHFLDENTKHYYYWNSETNAVTWNLPQDYSEYLVRLKLYHEAVAAGRKTLPAASMDAAASNNVSTADKQAASGEEVCVAISNTAEATEEVKQSSDLPDEIGPQLPKNLRSHLPADVDSATTIMPEADASVSADTIVTPVASTDTVIPSDAAVHSSVTDSVTESADIPHHTDEIVPESVTAVVKSLGGIVGYESDSPSENEDPPCVETNIEGGTAAPKLKSLVAYDDTYTVNDEEENEAVPEKLDPPAVSGPQLPAETEDTNQMTNGYSMQDYSQGYEQMYSENTDPNSMIMYDQYSHYQGHLDYGTAEGHATLALGATSGQDTDVVYGPVARDVSYGANQEAPLVFTGAPPPPPPPLEQAEEKSNGLSSMEISEFSSVIMEKLDFLDTQMSSLSKLQLLLVQLKTRLDDWQAGGLSKHYLIERLEETDALLEICESESAPVGWKCNWSRKEKQYYYIHEITDELSWSYPQDDVEAVKKLAARQDGKSSGQSTAPSGTLSHLSQAIEARTVDADLKALFLQKVIEKCTDTMKESTKDTEGDAPNDKAPTLPSESSGKAGGKADAHASNENKSKEMLKESSSKSSKTKRPLPEDSDCSDDSYKSKKAKHKQKSEQVEKKHKKHSKHKKNKSSSKKSKQKKRHSRSSSSEEPGEVKPKKSSYKPKTDKKINRSPVQRIKTPDSSPDTKAARLRLSSKIFKLDHSGSGSKPPQHSSSSCFAEKEPKEKIDMFDNSSRVVAHTPSPHNMEPSTTLQTSKRKEDSISISHRSPSPLVEFATEIPPMPKTVKDKNSDDEMEISSGSSRPPSPELEGDAAINKTPGHIDTEDDMESFLQSIQRDMHAGKSSQSMVNPEPLSGDHELPPPISSQQLPPPKPKPKLSASKITPELPTPKPVSRAGAPVFYEAPAEKQKVVMNAPVLYSAPTVPAQQEPPVPNLPVSQKDVSPVRFPEVSQQAPAVAETSKPVKDKSKHKKSSKKGSKMPAALVQKWQKVQSEITTDIEKEIQMKKELLS